MGRSAVTIPLFTTLLPPTPHPTHTHQSHFALSKINERKKVSVLLKVAKEWLQSWKWKPGLPAESSAPRPLSKIHWLFPFEKTVCLLTKLICEHSNQLSFQFHHQNSMSPWIWMGFCASVLCIVHANRPKRPWECQNLATAERQFFQGILYQICI